MLRPYQVDIDNQVVSLMRKGIRRILVVSVTGSGKTVLASHFLNKCFNKAMSALFNVHRIELVKQSAETFAAGGVPFGIIAPSFPNEYDKTIQVCSIPTLAKRVNYLRNKPNLIIWDECHHLPAANWTKIFNMFPNAYHIGLTATPLRLDGRGLGTHFEAMVLGPTMEELIDDGYLTDYAYFSSESKIDFSGVHKRMGDHVAIDLAKILDVPKIRGDVFRTWEKKALNKKTIIFSVNVEHSKNTAQEFVARGFAAEHIDGGTDKGSRSASISRYKKSETLLLSNVDLFGEGFDVPNTECVVQLRLTESLSLFLQQCGRALRTVYHPRYTRKELEIRSNRLQAIADSTKPRAIILDLVRNWETHGFPDDPREWSLEGKKKSTEKSISAKQCPKCYYVDKGHVKKCSECGHEYTFAPLKAADLRMTDEEVKELDVERIKQNRRQQQATAKTKEELVALGKSWGYKKPHQWAQFVLKARSQKKSHRGVG